MGNFIKKFILKQGRGLVDTSASLLLIIALVSGIKCGFFGQDGMTSIIGFAILLIGVPLIILSFYFLYLLIDIRDSIKAIADNNNEQKEQ